MEMFPQKSWKVIDQWLQLFQPLLIWVCLTKTTCSISIFPTGYMFRYYITSCMNSSRLFNVSEIHQQKFLDSSWVYMQWYSQHHCYFWNYCCVKSKLSTYPKWFFKSFTSIIFVFSNINILTCSILIFLSYQISSPFMHIFLGGSHWTGLLVFVGKGDEIVGDVSNTW